MRLWHVIDIPYIHICMHAYRTYIQVPTPLTFSQNECGFLNSQHTQRLYFHTKSFIADAISHCSFSTQGEEVDWKIPKMEAFQQQAFLLPGTHVKRERFNRKNWRSFPGKVFISSFPTVELFRGELQRLWKAFGVIVLTSFRFLACLDQLFCSEKLQQL